MSSPIIILDDKMEKEEVRIIKSASEILGFDIRNETEGLLFVQVRWSGDKVKELVIRNDE